VSSSAPVVNRRGKRIPGGDCLEEESGHGRHLWEITAVRDLFSLTLAVVALFLVYYLRDVFAPILISLGLAYLFDPVIDWAERHWRMPWLMTRLLLLVIFAVTAIVMVAWLGPILARQAVSFVQNLPGYIDRLSKQYRSSHGRSARADREGRRSDQEGSHPHVSDAVYGDGPLFRRVGPRYRHHHVGCALLSSGASLFIFLRLAVSRHCRMVRALREDEP